MHTLFHVKIRDMQEPSLYSDIASDFQFTPRKRNWLVLKISYHQWFLEITVSSNFRTFPLWSTFFQNDSHHLKCILYIPFDAFWHEKKVFFSPVCMFPMKGLKDVLDVFFRPPGYSKNSKKLKEIYDYLLYYSTLCPRICFGDFLDGFPETTMTTETPYTHKGRACFLFGKD